LDGKVKNQAEKESIHSVYESAGSYVCAVYPELPERVKRDGVESIEYVLKPKVETSVLEKMGKVFEVLGYFDMSNIVKDKANNIIGGLFGKK
jgi:hypothetical protein